MPNGPQSGGLWAAGHRPANPAPQLTSSLPQDSPVFQRYRDAGTVWDHARRVVGSRAHRGHRCAVSVATACAIQLAYGLHLLSHGTVAVDAVGVKLYSHRARVQIAEI